MNEVWPHFSLLATQGSSAGCTCPLCPDGRKKPKSRASLLGSDKTPVLSRSARPRNSQAASANPEASSALKPDEPPRRKQVDEEGIPDYYRSMLDKIKAAGPKGVDYENIIDSLSPDWRAGHNMLQGLLTEWQQQPTFVPRVGELVLFSRSETSPNRWEVGVVTQLPTDTSTAKDLNMATFNNSRSIAYSGFRIEPLSDPGKDSKPFTAQHKYVPLYALRPFICWQQCVNGIPEDAWHPTLKHALKVANSFCLIGKFCYKGTWPEATLFARGLYLGPELIMIGDAVRLVPREIHRQDVVTDVMVISSIRLRFVNLDDANDDDRDNDTPYNTCIHISGRAYTIDRTRSFDGVGDSPATAADSDLPPDLLADGNWFHVVDPRNKKARLEIPYHRILGKCMGRAASQQWFQSPDNHPEQRLVDLSQGLTAMRDARAYSRHHDARIDTSAGKAWLWAETRIEQLDLHEINGRFVGPKDDHRTPQQVRAWRQALRVLDGRRDGLEQYYAAKRQREQEEKQHVAPAAAGSSSWGMMANAQLNTQMEGAADSGPAGDGDAMDVTDPSTKTIEVVNLDDSDEDGGGAMAID
jgi:hypothetical protein